MKIKKFNLQLEVTPLEMECLLKGLTDLMDKIMDTPADELKRLIEKYPVVSEKILAIATIGKKLSKESLQSMVLESDDVEIKYNQNVARK